MKTRVALPILTVFIALCLVVGVIQPVSAALPPSSTFYAKVSSPTTITLHWILRGLSSNGSLVIQRSVTPNPTTFSDLCDISKNTDRKVDTVTPGNIYTYRLVQRTKTSGDTLLEEVSVTMPLATPAITAKTFVRHESYVGYIFQLEWSAVSGASLYEVLEDGQTESHDSMSTRGSGTSQKPNAMFKVRAVSSSGVHSEWSAAR